MDTAVVLLALHLRPPARNEECHIWSNQFGEALKTSTPPELLTYFMVKWQDVKQHESDQKCQVCGRPLNRTEEVVDKKGHRYEGYVCHPDRQVTWVRIG
jgi:hypothetical protein